MTYTGDVQVGGPTQVRVLDELEIRKAAVGPMQNNAYLLTCRAVGAQLLVDAADDPDRLLALLQEGTAQLDLVVTTHRHPDHHRALASVVAVTGAAVAAGADDADAIAEATDIAVTQRLHDGDTVRVGNVDPRRSWRCAGTPRARSLSPTASRADACTCSPATRSSPAASAPRGARRRSTSSTTDVVERVFDRFDDDTWVYPGHGRDTTLGAEREHLPEWRARGW